MKLNKVIAIAKYSKWITIAENHYFYLFITIFFSVMLLCLTCHGFVFEDFEVLKCHFVLKSFKKSGMTEMSPLLRH